MNELKKYLKQATRGLPRTQKQDLWNELEADILERVSHLRSFGLSEQEALQKTLKQFGAAQGIQKGMHQVYTLPRIARIAGLTLMSSVLFLPGMKAVANAVADVQIEAVAGTYIMVPFAELMESLKQQKVAVHADDHQLTVTLPSGKTLVQKITEHNRQAGLTEDFVLNNWLDTAIRNGIPVKVSGWETLKFTMDSLTVQLKLFAGQQNFKPWYQDAARNWLDFKVVGATAKPPMEGQTTLHIQKPELAGKVVAVAAFQKGHPVYADVALADQKGHLFVKVPAGSYQVLQQAPGYRSIHNNALVLLSFKGEYTAGAAKPFQVIASNLKGHVKLEHQQTLQVH